MKNRSPLFFCLLLVLAMLPACAASATPSPTVEDLPIQADPINTLTTGETVEAPTTVLAGATAMPGGFNTEDYTDPLPVFAPLRGGGDDIQYPEPCVDYLTGGGPNALEVVVPPAVRVLNHNICVLGMEIVVGSAFTVTMESPDGEVYEADYLFEQRNADVVPVLQGVDEPRSYGWGMNDPDGPITIVPVDFSAGLAAGSWLITVRDGTGGFDQWTTALITHGERTLDLTPDWPPSPFRWHSQVAHFEHGDAMHIAGANYPPGTGIVIALYSTGGTPLYATRLISDGDGAFHTTLEAGADLSAGSYLLRSAVEPDVITEAGARLIVVQD
jgi:hypothetical protein